MNEAEVRLLEKLSEKVGTAGGQAWDILVNAAWQSAVADTIQYLILAIVVALYIKELIRWRSKEYTEAGYDIMIMGFGVSLLFLCLIAFVELHETIMGFINPEYWALKKIMAACSK